MSVLTQARGSEVYVALRDGDYGVVIADSDRAYCSECGIWMGANEDAVVAHVVAKHTKPTTDLTEREEEAIRLFLESFDGAELVKARRVTNFDAPDRGEAIILWKHARNGRWEYVTHRAGLYFDSDPIRVVLFCGGYYDWIEQATEDFRARSPHVDRKVAS